MNYAPENSYEKTIKELKNELWEARRTILGLLPPKLKDLLDTYHDYTSRQESYQWENTIFEKLLEHVNIIPDPYDCGNERAYCPLCGGGNYQSYEGGYALPEGLRRHITGYGKIAQCPVVKQISYLARECWDDKFSEKERLEREEKYAILKARKEKETLYLLGLNFEPQLIDEIVSSWNPGRNKEQLKWAESRIKDLGFDKNIDGRIISYLYRDGELCIYANPLIQNEIKFYAFKSSSKRSTKTRHHYYCLPDRFKNKLQEKYNTFVAEAKRMLKIDK